MSKQIKFTKEEKEEILLHLHITKSKAQAIANSEPAKRKTVWTFSEEEKKEQAEKASWLDLLIKKVEQL